MVFINNFIKKNNISLKSFVIVLACMLIQAIPFSVASNIQPLFISYVISGSNFSLTGFSLIFTIGTLVAAVLSPFVGSIYNKINKKMFFLIGCILSGAGFMAFSLANNLIEFYVIASIVQAGTTIFSSIGIPLLINSWFDEKSKGKMLSLSFAGGSLGNILLQEIVTHSLITIGYKRSYLLYGFLSLAVSIPITLLLLKFPKNKNNINSKNNKNNKSVSLKNLKTNKAFYLFLIGFIFIGLSIAALSIQYPNYFRVLIRQAPKFSNFTPQFIGTIGTIFAIFSLFGNLVGGFFFDKLGVSKTVLIAFTFSAISCLSLMFAPNLPILVYVFAVFKGLSVFSYMMTPAYLSNYFFGSNYFSLVLGVCNLIFALGFSLGSTIFALVISYFGYFNGWSLILIFLIIAFSSLLASNYIVQKERKLSNAI